MKGMPLISEPGTVRVRVNTSWRDGICLPDFEGTSYEEAVFRVLTFGDNAAIERVVSDDVPVAPGRPETVRSVDPFEFRRILLRRNLLSWTLDVPIERRDGWITDESWKRVKRVQAPILQAFMDAYESLSEVTPEEEALIDRQAAVLFAKHSRGVADACEAVSMFCILSNYWERYGVTRGVDIMDMPLREYLMLRIMDSKASENMRRSISQNQSARPRSKIATARGVRPSRGVVVPE